MYKKIIILSLILLSGCVSKERCKDIAIAEADNWKELGYNQGLSRGLDICDEEYEDRYCTYKGEVGSTLVSKVDTHSGWDLNPSYPNCESAKKEILEYLNDIECK